LPLRSSQHHRAFAQNTPWLSSVVTGSAQSRPPRSRWANTAVCSFIARGRSACLS
jgi:hypothetical protein